MHSLEHPNRQENLEPLPPLPLVRGEPLEEFIVKNRIAHLNETDFYDPGTYVAEGNIPGHVIFDRTLYYYLLSGGDDSFTANKYKDFFKTHSQQNTGTYEGFLTKLPEALQKMNISYIEADAQEAKIAA